MLRKFGKFWFCIWVCCWVNIKLLEVLLKSGIWSDMGSILNSFLCPLFKLEFISEAWLPRIISAVWFGSCARGCMNSLCTEFFLVSTNLRRSPSSARSLLFNCCCSWFLRKWLITWVEAKLASILINFFYWKNKLENIILLFLLYFFRQI